MTELTNTRSEKDIEKFCSFCGIEQERSSIVTGAYQSICKDCIAICAVEFVDLCKREAQKKDYCCAFCGAVEERTTRLISGPVCICNKCIDLANEVLAERKAPT